ncbi:Tyrosine-protein kinase, partial [Parasponia andersonii]
MVCVSHWYEELDAKISKNNDEDNIEQVPGMPLQFSYEDLEIATENFKETLGRGGFGSVFKGVLADGTMIAVKRLNKISRDMREFLAEKKAQEAKGEMWIAHNQSLVFILLEILQKKAQEDQFIDIVEDLDEEMQNNREEVESMIRIGAWRLQNNHTKRPCMSTAVKVLEGVMEVDPDISYKFSHAMASASIANDHITIAPEASILSAPRWKAGVVKRSAAAITINSSYPRTSYTYYIDSGLPSTWYTNNSVVMNGWNMRVILSAKGFYCGFYCSGSCSFYLFSVVAVGGGNHSAVWSVNTDQPLRENASVQLTRDKGLVLRDSDGVTVWSAPSKVGKPVVGVNLTEAGNLVLFDNQSAMVWQSFDHPVDTLLIGQRLYKGQKLVPSSFVTLGRESPFFSTLASDANFSAFFNTSDGRSLMYYQLRLDKSSRNQSGLQYAEARNAEFVVNLGRRESSYPRKYIEYVKFDADGHLRTYWHNLEGSGYNAVDLVTQECLMTSQSRYFLTEVMNSTYSNTSNSGAPIASNTTINGCKQACLQSCSCSAIVFIYENDVSDGNCFMPSEIFSTGNNTGNRTRSLAFVKELNPNAALNPSPAGVDLPTPPSRHRRNLAAIVSASISGGLIIILLIIASLLMLKNSRSDKDGKENIKKVLGMPLQFSFEELEIATENFKETLGSGGFGSVFKGILKDGTGIAVKRLDKMSQGMREFLAEVETIGSIHHFNLV